MPEPPPPAPTVSLRIRLPFKDEAELAARYARNFFAGGMFIATKTPKPPGVAVAFELLYSTAEVALRGEGFVARSLPDGPRPGMVIQFTRLDEASRALVDRLVPPTLVEDDEPLFPVGGGDEPMTPAHPAAGPAEPVPAQPAPAGLAPAPAALAAARPFADLAAPAAPVPLAPPVVVASPAPRPFSDLPAPAPVPAAPPPAIAPDAPRPFSDLPAPAAPAAAPPPAVGPGAVRDVVAAVAAAARERAAALALEVEGPSAVPSGPVIGIDLGTTNSRLAAVIDGTAKILPLRGGAMALPTVVSLDERGRFLVGQRARAQILVDPRNTVFGAKRLLGRRFEGQRVQQLVLRFPYEVAADDDGDSAVVLRGSLFSLVELTSHILGELRDAAQEALHTQVSRAVISVPAYYRDRQRQAVRKAAALAGLHVERLISEPTATAIAFGLGKALARKRVLVFDLGGGTFDASVLEITGDEIDVVATGGDDFLGGQDFDERVADELERRFEASGQGHVAKEPVVRQRLRDAAEAGKIDLSWTEASRVRVPWIGHKDAAPVDLDMELARGELEDLTRDLVERSVEVTVEVLAARGIKPEQVDELVLTGGQTQMPLVRRRVADAFGREPRTDIDPHDSVALGAALLGASLDATRDAPGIEIREVLASPVGILFEGKVQRLLERNTQLPAEKMFQVYPPAAGEAARVAFYQGDGEAPESCELLGVLSATPPQGRTLQVVVRVDADAILHATAQDARTGKDLQSSFATAGTSAAAREALERSRAAMEASAASAAKGGRGLLGGLRRLFGGKG